MASLQDLDKLCGESIKISKTNTDPARKRNELSNPLSLNISKKPRTFWQYKYTTRSYCGEPLNIFGKNHNSSDTQCSTNHDKSHEVPRKYHMDLTQGKIKKPKNLYH